MRAYERLLKYAAYDTASREGSQSVPSTPGQLILAQALVEEMKALGLEDARVDAHGYVYGSIPANAPGQPAIGLIAHMDTVDNVPCQPINARVIAFDGRAAALNGQGEKLSVDTYPFLKKYAGQHLVVTDGGTLLGADDKAGIAEILTLCQRLMEAGDIPHGKVCVAFTPDEEIGRGTDFFDLAGFGADFAYTVDGGELGEIEYENFNAAGAQVVFHGVDIHPGSAKDKMKNALRMACELVQMLPAAQSPEHTQGYEGFYHVTQMGGSVERAWVRLILRDHDMDKFQARKALVGSACAYLEAKYGPGSVELDMKDSYYNMASLLKDRQDILDRAIKAMEDSGVTPVIGPIRGGTDGARLTYMGLPCPNLSTGGMNGHSRHECACVESMDKMVEVLLRLVTAR